MLCTWVSDQKGPTLPSFALKAGKGITKGIHFTPDNTRCRGQQIRVEDFFVLKGASVRLFLKAVS